MSISCTVSDILSLISQNLKRSRDSEHIPFWGYTSSEDQLTRYTDYILIIIIIMHARMHALLCINQHNKFEVTSFTNSKDMIGQNLKKNGSRVPDHAHWRHLVISWQALNIFYLHTEFGDSHFSRSSLRI